MGHDERTISPFLATLFLVLIGIILLAACGGGVGLPHSNQVTAQITPAQTSVKVGQTTSLQGSATGFTQSPIIQWWIQEAKNSGDNDDCGYLTLPPMSNCQFGYVVFGSVTQFPSSATYYAPIAPGTYHVTFEAGQYVAFDHVTKTATATVTVTP